MKALKKIVKKYIGGGKGKRNLQENTNESNKDDDITESFINYGKHIIPLIIFLIFSYAVFVAVVIVAVVAVAKNLDVKFLVLFLLMFFMLLLLL